MTKAELVDAVASTAGTSKKDTEAVLKALPDVIVEVMKSGDSVAIPGLGTFTTSQSSAREGINPLTKERIRIPEKTNAKLRFSSSVKKALN